MDHEVGGRLILVRMVLPGCRPPTCFSLQNYCCYAVGVRLKRKSYSAFLHLLVALPHLIVILSDGSRSGRATWNTESVWWITKWEGDWHHRNFQMVHEVGGRLASQNLSDGSGSGSATCISADGATRMSPSHLVLFVESWFHHSGSATKNEKAILIIKASFTF